MPNDLEYGLYMPADNVRHDREAGFGRGGILFVHMAGGLSKIHSQIISLIHLFTKLFQKSPSPCLLSDFETGSQMLFIDLCQREGHSAVGQIVTGLHQPHRVTMGFPGLGKGGVGLQVPWRGVRVVGGLGLSDTPSR